MTCSHLKMLATAVVTAGAFLLATTDADARWGSSGGSSGGSWGSSGGSSGGSWGSSGGSSGGSWGSSGGSHGYRRAWRRHRRWGSSGGSWGSSGGSSGGSWGSSGGSSGYYRVVPAPSKDSAPAPPSDGGSQTMTSTGDARSVMLSVSVPDNAKVFINGNTTNSVGAERSYVSRGLQLGRRYKYEVRAEITRDGKQVNESKVVYVRAGDRPNLSFDFDSAADESIAKEPARPSDPTQTTLRLHVPSGAKVWLAGSATKSTGDVREFSTTRLSKGQIWENYVVRAELSQGGNVSSREVTVALKGGETRDLTIDFDSAQVASVASAR